MDADSDTIKKEIIDGADGLVKLLKDLVAIPSPPGRESNVLNYAVDFFSSIGIPTAWIDIEQPGLKEHPAFIPWGACRGRNLLAVWGQSKAQPERYPVLFNGHVDVVPPGEISSWTYPPHQPTVQENSVYGNGAADTKGGIACLLYVLGVLSKYGFVPAKPIAVELVIDEERMGNGTLANVLAGVSAEQAIFLEPGGCDCIVSGHRGAIMFRLTLRGGENELTSRGTTVPVASRLVEVFDALEQWKQKRYQECTDLLGKELADRMPLYFGKIRGGHWFSAPLREIHIDGVCGYVPGENRQDIENAFRQHFSSTSGIGLLIESGELAISFDRGFVEPSETPADSPLVKSLQKAAASVLGEEPRIEPCINSGCDMRLRRLYDHNCHCVWYGPAGSRCHQNDESVFIDELVKVSRVIAEWIIRKQQT